MIHSVRRSSVGSGDFAGWVGFALLAGAVAGTPHPALGQSSGSPFASAVGGISAITFSPRESERQERKIPDRWAYLAQRFEAAGLERQSVVQLFTDSRLPEREDLVFSLDPKESRAPYRRLNTLRNRRNALAFYQEHRGDFTRARDEYQVPEGVILAILQVETFCGKNTGSSRIFPGLARLASAADPENIKLNLVRHGVKDNEKLAAKVLARAKWLEDTFLPNAVAAVRLAKIHGVDVFELRGSSSGAFGYPQFLPANYFEYGVDADGDQFVNLFDGPDAILSVARFLQQKGWAAKDIPRQVRRDVIWEYNRSVPYIDTVLSMSSLLQREIDRANAPKKPVARAHRSRKQA